MKYISTIIKNIFKKELPKPVGRWGIEHSNIQINSKIDLSNEDHCGPCGQYALTKIEPKNSQHNKNTTETRNLFFENPKNKKI